MIVQSCSYPYGMVPWRCVCPKQGAQPGPELSLLASNHNVHLSLTERDSGISPILKRAPHVPPESLHSASNIHASRQEYQDGYGWLGILCKTIGRKDWREAHRELLRHACGLRT